MTPPLLSVRGVKAYYGHIAALRGVDVDVGEGEIVALIGANGAGKSTLMMTIFGNPRAREGRIVFGGRDITQLPTHVIARLKIAQAPEGRRIFVRMTVMENLQMGAAVAEAAHFQSDVERVFALFPRLKERMDQRGGTLSGGEQQMLAIARALMGHPRLLLLDEPSLGLAPLVARQIFDAIKRLNSEEKLTVFLVEQNAFHALKLAHRGYVMVNGRITLSGSGRELLDNRPPARLDGERPRARRKRPRVLHAALDRQARGVKGDRRHLATVVASRALHASSEPCRALPSLRPVRRQVLVAALLSRRLRGLSGLRLGRISPHARQPHGHSLQLDQRARGPFSLATPRRYASGGYAKIRVTFPPFAA